MIGQGLATHGVGNRQDLPVSLPIVAIAASATLVVTFALLAARWRSPHLATRSLGRPLPSGAQRILLAPALPRTIAGLGLALVGYCLLGLVFGPDDARNPTPHVIYIFFWIGLVPLSTICGPVWRWLNPVRNVHRILCRAAGMSPTQGILPLPAQLGYWPAAVGLLCFTWLELIATDNASQRILRLVLASYVGFHLLATVLFGSRWLDRGDAFEVWSGLFGRLSPVGTEAGQVRLRWPALGLLRLDPAPGLAVTVAVMLGSTAYDGAANSPLWFGFVQSSSAPLWWQSVGLLTMIGGIWLLLELCARLTGHLIGAPPAKLAARFAPSVIPVALGYVVAHYWSQFILEGQRGLIRLNDPLAQGSNWLGLRDFVPDQRLLDPQLVAGIQVSAVVVGHVLGIVLAHEIALTYARRRAMVGQLPLLLLMVGLTFGGLYLLFSG